MGHESNYQNSLGVRLREARRCWKAEGDKTQSGTHSPLPKVWRDSTG